MAYGFNDDKTKANIEAIANEAGAGKVDKVEGQSLSDNNYTNTDKNIVNGIPTALSNKVDKVSGKGLSTNDFTALLKTKTEEASYNAYGGDISLGGYTADNPFTCPHDGYICTQVPTSFYGGIPYVTICIKGSGTTWLRVTTAYYQSYAYGIFVKKGMKVYPVFYPNDTTVSAWFVPQTSYV